MKIQIAHDEVASWVCCYTKMIPKVKKFLLLSLVLSLSIQVIAQELRCNVIINDERVQTQDRQVIAELSKAITTFMNTTQWTDDRYEEWERIECNILITLDKNTNIEKGRYSADAQIQYNRVIYNSNYNSPILNYFDKNFDFSYSPSEPLIYIENSNNNNLTMMLAYYAYVILALDYDTFSPLGGSPLVEKAQNILNNVQSSGTGNAGWTNADIRSRFWLAENLNNPQFLDVRKSLYNYHRQGLDKLLDDPQTAATQALETVRKWKELAQIRLNALLLQTLLDAKGEELYNLFAQAPKATREEAGQILLNIDPAHAELYRKLLQ